MSQCTPQGQILWPHISSLSAVTQGDMLWGGTITPTSGCMCVSLPPKRKWCHQSFTWWCGWLSMMSLLHHYYVILKNIKGSSHNGTGIPSCWFWENTGLITNVTVLGCVPHWVCQEYWIKRNTFLVYISIMIVHCYHWASVCVTSICLGSHWVSVPTQEDLSTRQQWPLSLISDDRGLWLIIGVYPIISRTVTVLWHPWVGLKERESMSKCVSIGYLLNNLHWGLLFQVLNIKLTGVQYSTPALSCC